MLMAEGYVSARSLASKFYGLYSLLRDLLSKQSYIYTYIVVLCTLAQQIQLDRHYDWGLRAVKSVLVVAGQLKRAEPELPEDQLLMRALRDFNIPKIVQQDEIVFFGA